MTIHNLPVHTSSVPASTPAQPRVSSARPVLAASLAGTLVGFNLMSVISIVMPRPPLAADNLPDGIAGMVWLRGRCVPVVTARERFERPGCARRPARHTPGERMIVVGAGTLQAAFVVDEIAAITAPIDPEEELDVPASGEIGRSAALARLIDAGCATGIIPVVSRAGGVAQPAVVVDTAAFLHACCPSEGLDALRTVQARAAAWPPLAGVSGVWRGQRRVQGRRAA